MRLGILASIVVLALAAASPGEEPPRWTLELEVNGKQVEGSPLAWDDSRVELLLRDGKVLTFAPSEASGFRKSSSSFRSYSLGEFRKRLTQELGAGFEISGTGHYIVAHPHGQRDYWSPRFEELYRSFMHYFSARGFRLTEPEFPLVAIVFRNQHDFLQYARKEGARIGPDAKGYYSPDTNRVSLFDVSGGNANADNWHEHAETIIHEATHQTAFNTGVHRRFSAVPAWVVEGLATMFEAPGVWNSRQHTTRGDRLNRGRLSQFQRYLERRKSDSLVDLISSDRRFDLDPGASYAESWAFSFFLAETQPRKYSQYLALTARRPPFAVCTPAERMADFTEVFGKDLKMLDARFLRFISEIK
jgi:hypothetical protein